MLTRPLGKNRPLFSINYTDPITDPDTIKQQAQALGIDLARPYTLLFLLLHDQNPQTAPAVHHQTVTAILDRLTSEPDLLTCPTPEGLGILDYAAVTTDCQTTEINQAFRLKALAEACAPKNTVYLGIAGPDAPFAAQYRQAKNAIVLGRHAEPAIGVYHYSDYGFLATLNQYVNPTYIAELIDGTIGKILEYDRENHTELFLTLEQLVFHNSLHEVARNLFVHYKTVAFRKQNIEKILGFTINSFAGRTILGVALTLYYLREIPTDQD
jgi:sugar diacid utilization regulator